MLLVSLLALVSTALATDIKWTPGDNSQEAHTAPKSQKYWDEHGIERPDYAKTDAELYGEGFHWSNFLWIGVVAGLILGWYVKKVVLDEVGGNRLGGGNLDPEQARKARLAHLEGKLE